MEKKERRKNELTVGKLIKILERIGKDRPVTISNDRGHIDGEYAATDVWIQKDGDKTVEIATDYATRYGLSHSDPGR